MKREGRHEDFNSLQTGQNTTKHATTDNASMHWDNVLPSLLLCSSTAPQERKHVLEAKERYVEVQNKAQ